jgi:plastocyanin
MMRTLGLARLLSILMLAAVFTPVTALAQSEDVHATVVITHPNGQKGGEHAAAPTVVVWLSPLAPDVSQTVKPGHFRMAQKNKSFHPHLLVVPLGSTISFPNLDPFFHNVFSQFNGKSFDLGLYEAGSSKDVRFDQEGISYIFCDIHPEMSAVVITLATPWYAVSPTAGSIDIRTVPPGAYELHVWAEGADAKQLEALTRRVHIDASNADLGTIRVATSATPPPHKNKFGADYTPDPTSPY